MQAPLELTGDDARHQEVNPTSVIPQKDYSFVLKNLIGDLRKDLSRYESSWGLPTRFDKKRDEVINQMRAFLKPSYTWGY